jgi:hypothetical protein
VPSRTENHHEHNRVYTNIRGRTKALTIGHFLVLYIQQQARGTILTAAEDAPCIVAITLMKRSHTETGVVLGFLPSLLLGQGA